ncbi:MAG: DivIVA domain-containing protein [Bacteroidia bacterium]|nr:DivIVA domain-containing protein [Bacteroidia bacterium]
MITPIEIRQHTFKKGLRGYDKEEVTNFLNTISMEWEKVLEEFKKTRNELDKTQSNLDSLKQVESVLHKTLLQAEQTSKSTIENAKKNAELKVAEAESRSREMLTDALKEKARVEMEISALINQRDEILQQLNLFLHSQAERLKKFEQQEMTQLRKRPEMSETVEVTESFFDSSLERGDPSTMINEMVEEL